MLDVAFVGAGANPAVQDGSGFSMAYRHGEAFDRLDGCDLVAVADVVPDNADAFAEYFGVDAAFESHEELLEAVGPDVVSVCTPPKAHAEIVVDCLRSGVVDAVHCEKPMASTWLECRRMHEAAVETDTQLTFNHQRRFGRPFRRAKELLKDGAIGELRRVEFAAPNLYDYGTHSFDLCNHFNDDRDVEWVIGQLDYREEDRWFGVHNENQALVSWEYDNGVDGLAATGPVGSDLVGCHNRLVGEAGTIEIGRGFPTDETDDRVLRVRHDVSDGWEHVDADDEGLHGDASAEYGTTYIDRAVEHVVDALRDGTTPQLGSANALRGTELVFAAWHSARERARVDLPLDVDDNPLAAMVDDGQLTPDSTDG
ncbi:MAG: Gfo/Idh/MocA family protein [Halolamina sp.]